MSLGTWLRDSFANLTNYMVRRRGFVHVLLFLVFLRVVAIPFLGTQYNYKQGEIARENITAKRDVVYVDVEKTKFKQNEVKRTISPIFVPEPEAADKTRQDIETLIRQLEEARRKNKAQNEAARDINAVLNIWVSPPGLNLLLRGYLPSFTRNVLLRCYGRMEKMLYFDQKRSFFEPYDKYGIILLRNGEELKLNPLEMQDVLFSPPAAGTVRRLVRETSPYLPANYRDAVVEVLGKLARPTVQLDQERTSIRERTILGKVAPVTRQLKSGESIARKGDRLSEQQLAMIRALNMDYRQTDYLAIGILGLFILGLYFLVAYHVNHSFPAVIGSNRAVYLTLFFLFINLGVAVLAWNTTENLENIPVGVFVPIAISSMSIAMLLGKELAFFLTVVFGYTVLLVTRADYISFAMVVGSGMLSIYTTSQAVKRIDLWKSGFFASLFSLFCLIVYALLRKIPLSAFLSGMVIAFINGTMSAIIVVGLIPFFESFLRIPTRFKLLELADTNTPLLKRMLIEASGTYTHSIIVGNLAESAAENIGANALLARVGSYYHDIGKIERASYFIENQQGTENKHKDLKPSVSRSILMSHVKRGVEMARAEGLPQVVIDFIEQHHGTSLMKFFYHQALDNKEPGISREDFRYPGPKPQTKETAILMLADSVEAASKTLKNPTPQRIENLVTEIMRNRFLEGELNESPLTLRDLTLIAHSFIKILNSLFHSRIEYPEEENIRSAESELRKQGNNKKQKGDTVEQPGAHDN